MTTVQTIGVDSAHYADVKRLWSEHRDTLGFMPDGAFADYADNDHLVVTLDASQKCVGYLLYRVVRDIAIIAHFCVSKHARKQGHARALINWLIQTTKANRGIKLSCRVDFAASAFWPRLGFEPVGRRPGRAGELETWWQGHGNNNLFADVEVPTGFKAVVDANVFLDLVEDRQNESQGLKADWLSDVVTLCFTSELRIELTRNEDDAVKTQRLGEARQLCHLECSAELFQRYEQLLSPLFASRSSERDHSDFRHLVRAVASSADAFITRDEGILDQAEAVYNVCGLAVVRPGEFISQIDVLQHEHLYQRMQIAGTTQVSLKRISEVDDELINATKTNDEKAAAIRNEFGQYLAEPQRFSIHRIDHDERPTACFVIDKGRPTWNIPFFRIVTGRHATSLAKVLLNGVVNDLVRAEQNSLSVSDTHCDASQFHDLGFVTSNGVHHKLALRGWQTCADAERTIPADTPGADGLKQALQLSSSDAGVAAHTEHLLWPMKLSDAPIPCYIVPIQPRFAEHLFDGRLSKNRLFGADADLALNVESAYYRSARPSVVRAPARVLWYVSECDRYADTKSIRACSRIVEVRKENAKQLFKRFRRLGVYEWTDVLETADRSVEKLIMAFRFDDTELLKPLPWEEFQAIFKKHEIVNNLQSPVRIPHEVFGEIYTACFDPSAVR